MTDLRTTVVEALRLLGIKPTFEQHHGGCPPKYTGATITNKVEATDAILTAVERYVRELVGEAEPETDARQSGVRKYTWEREHTLARNALRAELIAKLNKEQNNGS